MAERMEKTYSEVLDEHRAQRHEHFLKTAAKVFAENGIRRTSMEQLASAAGISKVVLYRYFRNKKTLVDAVLESIVDDMLEADNREADWWTQRVQRTLAVARNNPDAVKLLLRYAQHDPEYEAHFERIKRALTERSMERVVDVMGEPEEMPADLSLLAETVTAFFLDSYMRWIETGSPERDPQFLDWLTRSVRAMTYYWFGAPLPKDDSAPEM
jgi:AcrR family transcriptional regulator